MISFRFTGPGAWSTPVDEAVRDPRPVFLNALPDGFTGHGPLVGEIDSFLAEQPCGWAKQARECCETWHPNCPLWTWVTP